MEDRWCAVRSGCRQICIPFHGHGTLKVACGLVDLLQVFQESFDLGDLGVAVIDISGYRE